MIESIENIERTKLQVRDNFLDVLLVANAIQMAERIRPSKITAILNRLKIFFEVEMHLEDVRPDDAIVLAHSYFLMSQAKSKIAPTDVASVEFCLLQSVELLRGRETEPKAILTAVRVHNVLGRIHADGENTKQSLSFYEKAFVLYWNYTDGKDLYDPPVDILFRYVNSAELNCEYTLDQQYMLTLSGLIDLHEKIYVDNLYKSPTIIYQHMLLRKQVRLIPLTIDRLDWIFKVGKISEHLLMDNRFTEARNHLGIAFYMLKKFYQSEYKEIDETKFPEIKTSLYSRYSFTAVSIGMQAANYGIELLRLSVDRLLRFNEKGEQRETKPVYTTFGQKLPDMLMFTSTKKDIEEDFNIWITDEYIVNYSDAKAVFTSILRHFNEVWAYDIASPEINAQILQKISQASKYLAYYEPNENKQVLLHLWRIDLLKNAAQLFNELSKNNFDIFVSLEQAVTHVTILNTYLDQWHVNQKSKLEKTPNINYHVECALGIFQSYLNSHK